MKKNKTINSHIQNNLAFENQYKIIFNINFSFSRNLILHRDSNGRHKHGSEESHYK